MEGNTGSSNLTPSTTTIAFGKELPNVSTSQLLGIFGLIFSLSTLCIIAGFILSIMAYVKGKRAVKLYESGSGEYSEKSYKQARTDKTLGQIGFIWGMVILVPAFVILVAFVIFAISNPE